MDLLRDVQAYIETHRLFEPGARIVVGVSGGPDSVTLLHLLHRLRDSWSLALHVAHLHHGIRGADADADMAFVRALAEQWGLPYTGERATLPAIAEEERLSLEEAARRVRYAFLNRVATQRGAGYVAVGHNADDQAETVLMHLLRGAGPAGLRGMLPATRLRDCHLLGGKRPATPVTVIRPLLGTSRTEITAYCEAQGLEFRTDVSNWDTSYFRNQLRHEVLPYLAEVSPQIQERLQHLAEVVRADYQLLQEFVSVAWDTLLLVAYPDALVFDLVRWREQPLGVQRSLVRRAAYKLRRTLRDVDFEHVEQVIHVAQQGATGAQATLPRGLRATVGYTTLTIADEEALHLPPERPWLEPGEEIPLELPGVTPLSQGWSLHAHFASHWNLEAIANNPNPFVAWVDADALGDAPVLRTRRRGDRLQPQGMGGASMRLSDLLINVKVPRAWRDHLPLLEGGELLWVPGIRLSEKALVTPHSERVAYLRFRGPASAAREGLE